MINLWKWRTPICLRFSLNNGWHSETGRIRSRGYVTQPDRVTASCARVFSKLYGLSLTCETRETQKLHAKIHRDPMDPKVSVWRKIQDPSYSRENSSRSLSSVQKRILWFRKSIRRLSWNQNREEERYTDTTTKMSTIRLINPALLTFFSKLGYRVNEIRITHTYADYGNQTRLLTRLSLAWICLPLVIPFHRKFLNGMTLTRPPCHENENL